MSNVITKFLISGQTDFYELSNPPKTRDWMDVNNHHAYKCLPLVVANGFGWNILNPVSFNATWDGSVGYGGTTIKFDFCPETDAEKKLVETNQISSHFGNGIITFSSLNFILRTPKDVNVLVKGPTNIFKYGANALEAIMETDWLPYTFTLNWKLTKPGLTVNFEKGEPLACIIPFPRNYLEFFKTEVVLLEADTELYKEHMKWSKKRNDLGDAKQNNLYRSGIESIDSSRVFKDHQRSIVGCPFKKKENL